MAVLTFPAPCAKGVVFTLSGFCTVAAIVMWVFCLPFTRVVFMTVPLSRDVSAGWIEESSCWLSWVSVWCELRLFCPPYLLVIDKLDWMFDTAVLM